VAESGRGPESADILQYVRGELCGCNPAIWVPCVRGEYPLVFMVKNSVKKIARALGLNLSGWASSRYDRHVAQAAPKTYSQYGEDAALRGFMDVRCRTPGYRGFWVDVGAHHPTRFSNTRMFSEMGWRGINVDALKAAVGLFRRSRKRDVNVWTGVGGRKGTLDFFQFDEPAYDTFSRERVETLGREWGRELKEGVDFTVVKVPVVTLKDLLDEHLPAGQHIDFLTVDAEGMDLEILKSNDWTKYRPDFLLAETECGAQLDALLRSVGYARVGRGVNTEIWRLEADEKWYNAR